MLFSIDGKQIVSVAYEAEFKKRMKFLNDTDYKKLSMN